jgi:hypothetical protein
MQKLRWTAPGLCGLAVATISACGGGGDSAPAPAPVPAALTCDDSMKTAFAPDALTSVLLVKQYKAGDPFPNALRDGSTTAGADLCLVKLLVGPGNPGPASAPSTSAGIGIEVWLPAKAVWNARLHAVGNGGFAGTDETVLGKLSTAGANDRRSAAGIAAAEGAVTATTDAGHLGGGGAFAMNPDGTVNRTLWTDFASRGIHEEVVKAKALATAFYGSAPKYTYWDGGSGGGQQSLTQAQKYPEDFDGIVVGYPAINWTKFITAELYPQVVMQRDLGANMPAAQLNLMSNAAIGACDSVGGQHLGFPLDPSSCHYDPTLDPAVLCTASGGTNATAACVTTAQALAMNKIWYGMTADGSVPNPVADNGWAVNPSGLQRWYGLSRGTSPSGLAGSTPFGVASDQVALELQNPTLAQPSFLNATGNGQDGWKTLTYGQLSNAFDRGLALQAVFADVNADNPDLTAFKARGGKMIHYHGLNDIVIPEQGSINYYERVIAKFGSLSLVQDFYRMYLIPGMGHGPSNGTANPAANPPYPAPNQIYSLLTAWVETGVAPGEAVVMNSASPTPVAKSLPMCTYPKKAGYVSGDPKVATSYTCS